MQKQRCCSQSTFDSGWRFNACLGLLLLIATVLAYLPALHGNLLIDDESHITKPALQSLPGLWRIWAEPGITHQYYPALHTAFWIEHRLWGDAVFGYHLVNLLQHAAAALLLVALLRQLFCIKATFAVTSGTNANSDQLKTASSCAWLAGFLFALHPVCVESVAWISEQKNTLSTLLGLGAVLAYLQFDAKRSRPAYYSALVLFSLAVLSKSIVVTLPCVLLVIFWWLRGRLKWKDDVVPLIPWFVVGVAASLPVLLLAKKTWGAYAFANEINLSLSERVLLAGKAFCFYLSKLLWPTDLVFIYPRWEIQSAPTWQYVYPLCVVISIIVCLWMVRLQRGPLAAVLIFGGTLVPVVGFFNVFWFAFSYVGDHLQYLSCLAILTLVACGAVSLVRRIPSQLAWLGKTTSITTVGALGVLTWRQSHLYQNAETLYRATLARNPACWIAHYNLGDALSNEPGRRGETIAEWETALRLRPDFAAGHCNLGCLLAADPASALEAIKHFETAIRFKPDMAEAHANLALLLAEIPDRLQEAIEHFKISLRLQPESAETHNNYGNTLTDLPNHLTEGIEHIETALRLRPDYAEAHWNLSIALSRTPGRLQEAISHLETALRLKPDLEGGQEMLQQMRSMAR